MTEQPRKPAGIYILGGVMVLAVLLAVLQASSANIAGAGLSLDLLFAFFRFGIESVFLLATGIGLLRFRRWSRACAVLYFTVYGLFYLFFANIFGMLFVGVILYYLDRDSVRTAFGLPSVAGMPTFERIKSSVDFVSVQELAGSLFGQYREGKKKRYAEQVARAKVLEGKGDSQGAGRIYETVAAALEGTANLPQDQRTVLAEAHYGNGRIAHARSDIAAAVGYYEKASSLGLVLGDAAYILLGEQYALAGRMQDAVGQYVHCLRSDQADPAVRTAVVAALEPLCAVTEQTSAANRERALACNMLVLAADGTIPWTHYYLGLCRFLNGQYGEARSDFEKARASDASRPETPYYLGRCLLETGEEANALAMFRTSLKLNPQNAEASFLSGRILVLQLERGEALG